MPYDVIVPEIVEVPVPVEQIIDRPVPTPYEVIKKVQVPYEVEEIEEQEIPYPVEQVAVASVCSWVLRPMQMDRCQSVDGAPAPAQGGAAPTIRMAVGRDVLESAGRPGGRGGVDHPSPHPTPAPGPGCQRAYSNGNWINKDPHPLPANQYLNPLGFSTEEPVSAQTCVGKWGQHEQHSMGVTPAQNVCITLESPQRQ